jgi:hypothetical protein
MAAGSAAGSATTLTIPGWASRCVLAVTRPAPRCCGTLWLGGCGRGPPSTCIGRVSFAKVAEYQHRGAVHFLAIIRLDAVTDCGCPSCVAPPPAEFTADVLERAVRRVAAAVSVPCPMVDEDQGVTLVARWGEQLDVRHITEAGDETELRAAQVAGYVAKYATKATEALGVTLDHRIGEVELEALDLPAHVAELVRACWGAGRPPVADEPAVAEVGAHAWLRRPLLDQEPPLLDHPGGAAAGPGRLCHPPAPRECDPA